LREAQPELTAHGAKILAVGTGAHHQAEHLMATEYDFDCLVDPDRNLYKALGVEHIALNQWFRISTWRKYFRSWGQAKQGRITGDPLQAPGVAVIDADGVLRYLHRGVTLADYPTVDEVLAAVRMAVE
jgi:peroxiredoxin